MSDTQQVILITGAAQRIGLHCAKALNRQDYKVVISYRRQRPVIDTLTEKGIDCIQADFATVEGVESFTDTIRQRYPQLRAIIHNASDWKHDSSHNQADIFEQMMAIHARAPMLINQQLADRLSGEKADIIHLTDYVASTGSARHMAYAASKAASDHLVRAWHRTYGLPVLITNCSNNYGPNQFPEKLIPMVVLRALAGEQIPVYGTGENVRDWLYVRDHADAILCVLESGKLGETYNIGGEAERTNIDLVHEICAVLDQLRPRTGGHYADQIGFITDRPGHDRRYAMNITKIKTDLEWQPNTELETGLAKTVKWYLDNQKWWQKILTRNAATQRQGLAGIATPSKE